MATNHKCFYCGKKADDEDLYLDTVMCENCFFEATSQNAFTDDLTLPSE